MATELRGTGVPEPWVSKRTLAAHYEASIRWVESKLAEGMPSEMIGGMRRFRISETERWLIEGGEGGRP
jgi:hypothetical protein